MLVAGGAVVMQDGGSSYNHSSGSFKTEDGGFENIFPVDDDAEDTLTSQPTWRISSLERERILAVSPPR